MKPNLILLCFLLFTVPAPTVLAQTAGAKGEPEAFARDFSERFRRHVRREAYPAAALAIVQRDRVLVLATEGYRSGSDGKPADIDTLFRLASVSKTFAAAALGLLVDRGQLAWDDPLTHFAPEFRIHGDPAQIRLRHLLEHSSGLMPRAYDNLIEDGLTRDAVVARLADLPYLCDPGQCYGYQNVIFSMVEPAIAAASGQSYERWVQEQIFEPLAMHSANFGRRALVDSTNYAGPHVRSRGRWTPVRVQADYYRLPAAAGVNASITDMARWLQALLGNNPETLPPSLVAYLTLPRQPTQRQLRRAEWRNHVSAAHYGMGWRIYMIDDLQVNYHGGWVQGYRADIAFAPELDLGIAILLNAEASSISELSAAFWGQAKDVLGAAE
ncbi:MAG: beta-lactamase family protein [Xanthomonadales bacterium]|nr:beta-lactamase family protein [Xanthomonadales bacterium]